MNRVSNHLVGCRTCRAALRLEWAMFGVASGKAAAELLTDEVDAALLDDYATAPHKLTDEQTDAVEQLIETQPALQSAIDALRQLPESLDALMEGVELPIIQAIDTGKKPVRRTDGQKTISIWRRWVPVAAAAALVLVAISFFLSGDPGEMASLEATFPAITRSAAALEFTAPAEQFVFEGSVFVDPEVGHTYTIELLVSGDQKAVLSGRTLEEFDQDGFASFAVELTRGSYILTLHDIVGNDTLSVIRPFVIN